MFYLNLNAYLWECNQFFIIHAPSMLHPCIPFITHASSMHHPCIIHVLSLLYSCTIRTSSIHHPYIHIFHCSPVLSTTTLLWHRYWIRTRLSSWMHHQYYLCIIHELYIHWPCIIHASSIIHGSSMQLWWNDDDGDWAHQKCIMNCWIIINYLWWFMNEWWVNCEWIIIFIHSW